MSSIRRIIVGASGSPGSLRSLRYARQLARDLDATVVPVMSWLPPDGELVDRRTPCEELRRIWAEDAGQRLHDALTLAWGDRPADMPVQPVIRRGRPGPVLTNAACCPGDLLVVGAGRRGALHPRRTGQSVRPTNPADTAISRAESAGSYALNVRLLRSAGCSLSVTADVRIKVVAACTCVRHSHEAIGVAPGRADERGREPTCGHCAP